MKTLALLTLALAALAVGSGVRRHTRVRARDPLRRRRVRAGPRDSVEAGALLLDGRERLQDPLQGRVRQALAAARRSRAAPSSPRASQASRARSARSGGPTAGARSPSTAVPSTRTSTRDRRRCAATTSAAGSSSACTEVAFPAVSGSDPGTAGMGHAALTRGRSRAPSRARTSRCAPRRSASPGGSRRAARPRRSRACRPRP